MNILEKVDKKFVIMNAPFVAIWYVLDKISYLYRITEGNSTKKMQALVTDFKACFDPVFPSFHPVDILVGLAVIFVIKLKMENDKKNMKKLREGEEAGSARWGTKEDIKPFMSDNPFENVILSSTEGLTMKKPSAFKYGRNKNIEVIGGSGAGKTFCFIKSNLMQLHSSYVVTDPKGTVLVECGKLLKKAGYKIKVFNTINFAKSHHYNPFEYISKKHPEKDILKLVNTLILNTKGEGEKSGEDFWVKAERLLLSAYIGYIYFELPKEDRNFVTLLEMIDESETKEEDEDFENPVDIMFNRLKKRKPFSFAVRQYRKYKLAAGKTAKSIMISVSARMSPFDIEELREITRFDEMELEKIGDRKTAVFVIISDTDSTFNFLVSIMYTQMFNLLCERADDVYGGRLPIHVRCLLDEMANIGQIPNLEKLIATVRSREISMAIILQAKSQLKSIYKDNAETIEGCCDTLVFLGGSEKTTLKDMSEMLGKETIDVMNSSISYGQGQSSSISYQKQGLELMSQDKLAVMDGNKCIVRVRGVRPFLSDKYDTTKHPYYRWLKDYDERNAFDIEKYVKSSFREGTKLKMEENMKLDVLDVGTVEKTVPKENENISQ